MSTLASAPATDAAPQQTQRLPSASPPDASGRCPAMKFAMHQLMHPLVQRPDLDLVRTNVRLLELSQGRVLALSRQRDLPQDGPAQRT